MYRNAGWEPQQVSTKPRASTNSFPKFLSSRLKRKIVGPQQHVFNSENPLPVLPVWPNIMPTEKGVLVFRSYGEECVSGVFDVHGVSKGWLACRIPKPTTMYIRTGSALYNHNFLVQQLRLTAKQDFANASSGVFFYLIIPPSTVRCCGKTYENMVKIFTVVVESELLRAFAIF